MKIYYSEECNEYVEAYNMNKIFLWNIKFVKKINEQQSQCATSEWHHYGKLK